MLCKKTPTPFEHQQQAYIFCEKKDFFALFMEQGTGKSKIICMKAFKLFLDKAIDTAVIISPKAITSQWIDEQFKIHYPTEYISFLWEGKDTVKSKKEFSKVLSTKNKIKVFVVNVEAFRSDRIVDIVKKIKLHSNNIFCVVDESVTIKTPDTKRTKNILQLFDDCKYKAILTGTPTPNSIFDLYSQFNFLKKGFWKTSYFSFKSFYSVLLKRKTDNELSYNTPLDLKSYRIIKSSLKHTILTPSTLADLSLRFNTPESNILEINKMDSYTPYKNVKDCYNKINPFVFKCLKKDCLSLPEKAYKKLTVELPPEQKKAYSEMSKNFLTEYQGKELTVLNKLVCTLRLQMITSGLFPFAVNEVKKLLDKEGNLLSEEFETKYKYLFFKDNPKLKAVIEDVETLPDKTPIIIWANYKGEHELLEKELSKLKYSVACYNGATKQNARREIIASFNALETQIIVMNPATAGMGLNLQVCSNQYFFSNTFRADLRLQAEDRSHRIGQKNKCLYTDILAKSTIDFKVFEVLKNKENLIDYFRTGKNIF